MASRARNAARRFRAECECGDWMRVRTRREAREWRDRHEAMCGWLSDRERSVSITEEGR